MAVSDVFNSLTFGEVNSLDYGIYITGSGVFDAPERAVEMVEVPGRNGAVDLDAGHWKNIPVTYTAGTFATNEEDFFQKIKAFRNAILSQIGYKQLTDTYNPGEYRLALYSAGLAATPINRNQAGEFQLTFNCKPQRFLTAGEQQITVQDGTILNNPTLYSASPLIEVKYAAGTLSFNGYSIVFPADIAIGDYILARRGGNTDEDYQRLSVDLMLANTGDAINCAGIDLDISPWFYSSEVPRPNFTSYNVTTSGTGLVADVIAYNNNRAFLIQARNLSWLVGSADTKRIRVEYSCSDGIDRAFELSLEFDGSTSLTISIDVEPEIGRSDQTSIYWQDIICHSSLVGADSMMVDTEIGEAYKVLDGQIIDMNQHIILGSDLPKFAPGANEITFDGSARSIKITPRWWQL